MSRLRTETLSLPDTPLYGAALTVLMLLLFCVSALMLIALGWQYGATGGSPLEKFHPATFLAVGLALWAAALRGNPFSALIAVGNHHPLIVLYLLGILGLTLHAALVVGLPAAGFVDTFLLPIIVLLLFSDMSERRRRNLALALHLFFVVNTLLGVAEFVMGFRLTPLVVDGGELEAEWRSTALLGHPLANAQVTGGYMILLAIGGGRDLPRILRLPAFLLAAAGMIVFGGRAATAFTIIALAWIAVVRVSEVLSGARFDLKNVLLILVTLPMLAIAIAVLNDYGFFEQFMGRFVDDEGSASTRVVMFELFNHLSWYELLFGPDPRFIAALMVTYGLDYGIESFWIAMIMLHGLVVALAFFASLMCFAREILRRCGDGGFLVMVYFFAVASASLSLSAKTPILSNFVLMLLVLGNRPQVRDAVRRAPKLLREMTAGRPPVRALSPHVG